MSFSMAVIISIFHLEATVIIFLHTMAWVYLTLVHIMQQ